MAKVAKGTGSFKEDAIPFSKGKQKLFKDAAGLKKPTPDTSAQDAILEQQRLQASRLDEEENRRRKRLLSAAGGVRAFQGSALFRARPGDTSGGSAAVFSGGASSGVARSGYARSGGGARRGNVQPV